MREKEHENMERMKGRKEGNEEMNAGKRERGRGKERRK